jgi:hypothetical protein
VVRREIKTAPASGSRGVIVLPATLFNTDSRISFFNAESLGCWHYYTSQALGV